MEANVPRRNKTQQFSVGFLELPKRHQSMISILSNEFQLPDNIMEQKNKQVALVNGDLKGQIIENKFRIATVYTNMNQTYPLMYTGFDMEQ